ncbi:MAG: ATP-binding cassette domain-containing protein, partial [Casimicrobiaceae bacterium]
RENPLRAQALGHHIHRYKLLVFVIAAMYSGFGGGLLGLMQGFMPPDAFTFGTSGEIVMMTAIGGAGTLFGPLLGAATWLFLSDFFQTTLKLGATWKLVLGIVFVLLVVFLRHGLVGGIKDLYRLFSRPRQRVGTRGGSLTGGRDDLAVALAGATAGTVPTTGNPGSATASSPGMRRMSQSVAANTDGVAASGPATGRTPLQGDRTARKLPRHRMRRTDFDGPVLRATGLSKHYGGVIANSDIDFSVNAGELRGIIGPNGAGKSTFFKMLTCEVPPTSGKIVFEGRDITGMTVTDVCQLGLTKSYQVNQLFDGLTVGDNVTIATLAALRGKFKLDLLRSPQSVPGLREQVEYTLDLVHLIERRDTPVSELAYGEKRRLEV